ncbi:Hypothetical predicted protein [Pelobates cultripes]|uniref:Uncharacterized protein n=1 Tax=Pelobates cultripes TaxID=61616 RepID=A0AAD1VHZ0_PELCU|nr:Hypothetical predicted protein [Pelobates cultripes]
MAAPLDSPSTFSKEEILDAPDEIPQAEGLPATLQVEDLAVLATKGDIKALMLNI